MRYFDLHCNTLNPCYETRTSLLHNSHQLSVDRGRFDWWVQTFFACIGEDCRGYRAYRRFRAQATIFQNALSHPKKMVPYDPKRLQQGVCNALLAVENGTALGGKPERVEKFRSLGVRILSLTGDDENELAGGSDSDGGLTELGKRTVRQLEKHGILIDVSHLNRFSFWELCAVAKRPLIATHSNSFEMCRNYRNLDDVQICELFHRRGLIGIHFSPVLLNGESDAGFLELRRHIDRMLCLGGEDFIAIGSGFDGAAPMSALDRIEKIPLLQEELLKHYPTELVDKILFKNAQDFFERNL